MALTQVDISCDMGEGFGQWQLSGTDDARLMTMISSANIAAGFHAGDPNLIDRTVKLAIANKVGIGAHPGYRDLQGFGRRRIAGDNEELVNDIVYQVGAVREFARRHGGVVQHVKPHGALYMELAANEAFSRAFVDMMRVTAPDAFIYCMGASATYRIAKELGQPVVREFYADRGYNRDGTIVFARSVSRFDNRSVVEKVLRACLEGQVRTDNGEDIDIGFESICVHSDTPGAVELLEAIRTALKENDIRVVPVSEFKQEAVRRRERGIHA